MTDLNKLRQGLTCCINWESLKGHLPECESCPYADEREGTCAEMTAILRDALDAITPRMMSLREVELSLDEPVWLEERDDGVTVAIVDSSRHMDAIWMTIGGRKGIVKDCSMYGRTWRCWSMRPGDAERKAAWAD